MVLECFSGFFLAKSVPKEFQKHSKCVFPCHQTAFQKCYKSVVKIFQEVPKAFKSVGTDVHGPERADISRFVGCNFDCEARNLVSVHGDCNVNELFGQTNLIFSNDRHVQ